MPQTRRHLIACITMLLGSAAVFLFIVLMNSHSRPPPKPEQAAAQSIKVEKQKKKKKVKRPRPRPQRKARNTSRPAPVPNLGSGISNVALAMPGFDVASLDSDAQNLLGDTKKNLVMDERSVDEVPKATSRVAAVYPTQARKQGVTGYVKVSLLIGPAGDVERIKVLDAEPSGVFEESALSAIRRWRFKPAVYQAEHVRAWATQTVRFELN